MTSTIPKTQYPATARRYSPEVMYVFYSLLKRQPDDYNEVCRMQSISRRNCGSGSVLTLSPYHHDFCAMNARIRSQRGVQDGEDTLKLKGRLMMVISLIPRGLQSDALPGLSCD